jgi:hypothetical protein
VQETACQGSQLNHLLLTDPNMQALLKAAPQAARVLRLLCQMLGIRPDPGIFPPLPKCPARNTPAQETSAAQNRPILARCAPSPRRAPPLGMAWLRWRGIWMPKAIRPEKPA